MSRVSSNYFPFLLFSFCFLLSACASNHAAVSGIAGGPVEIPADIAGIVHAGGSRTQKELAYLNYLGTSWILHTFRWNDIEPETDEWDFLAYDTLVDKAAAAGIKVFGVLAYDHWRIHPDKKNHEYIPVEQIPEFLEFVRKTVEHFKGRIGAWCIWNEPNFHFWTGTVDEYIELALQTADAIREIDSEVILLGGAFNRGVSGLPEKFIRKLFESGAMDKVDAVAFHPYELNPARTTLLYDRFKKIMKTYGFEDKIWITEVGYPTGGWYPTKVSEKKFPAYVVQTFVLLAAAGSEKIFWYQMFDPHTRSAKDSEDFFGLIRSRRNYISKGAEAFRLCAVYLAGTVYRPDLPLRGKLPHSLQAFYFEQPDGSGGALVLWKEGSPSQVKLQSNSNGVFTAHDPVTGAATAISEEKAIKIGTKPVFVTWQGNCQLRLIK
ncbi:MAG: beta-galactosidase [Treponema sp.]|nr:beta-galactosidase [Treponema sp.]